MTLVVLKKTNMLRLSYLSIMLLALSTGRCVWAQVKPEPPSPPAPTTWVEAASDAISSDFPSFAQLPRELSFDEWTQEELDSIRQALYNRTKRIPAEILAMYTEVLNRELEKKQISPEHYTETLARDRKAEKNGNDYGACWSFLYKKINGKKQNFPIGFRLSMQNGSFGASGLKVNGTIRDGLSIEAENTINSQAAFWLATQRPLVISEDQKINTDRWYYKQIWELQKDGLSDNFRLAAFGEFVPEKDWQKYAKDRLPAGVKIDSRQTSCSVIATSCRVYSFKVDRLKWTSHLQGIPRNSELKGIVQLGKATNVNNEFAVEDTCPGTKWGVFQQALPGISRGFGHTISGYYESFINAPYVMKRSRKDSASVVDQLKPFVKKL